MSDHEFDRQKWATLSLFEQMGNIGSEVGRTMNALRRGDEESMRGAFYRGLDLIDASLGSMTVSRKQELLRAREEFSAAVENGLPDSGLEAYFMNYAIAARMAR